MDNLVIFDRPTMSPNQDGTWRLVYDWTLVFRGEYYHVDAGFVTDGATIPRPLWWVCGSPMDVPRLYAAIVHDWIYDGHDMDATRRDADDIYRDIQIELGRPKWKCRVEWCVLRLFGWMAWWNDEDRPTTFDIFLVSLVAIYAILYILICVTIKIS